MFVFLNFYCICVNGDEVVFLVELWVLYFGMDMFIFFGIDGCNVDVG